MRYRAYFINSFDPWFNLAVENWKFRTVSDDEITLLLWVNSPCVVLGRFQNPLIECDLDFMKKKSISLVRRQSGGGTVYHDSGNLNFSFISRKKNFNQKFNNSCLLQTLEKLGIKDVTVNERNSLYVEGKKISGSAYKESAFAKFHHGTLLLNSDLENLQRSLRSTVNLKDSRGIPSVRDFVINLEMDLVATYKCMAETFLSMGQEQGAKYEYLCEEELLEVDMVSTYKDSICSWDWIYGETPKFSKEIVIKNNDHLIVGVKKGVIDFLEGEIVERFCLLNLLVGTKIKEEELIKAKSKIIRLGMDQQVIEDIVEKILFF